MSATSKKTGRVSVPQLRARKGLEPIVCLTAYTTPMAQRLDEHCDLLLVGDSLGMVVYGMESTLAVTVDMMVNHGKAVMRGSQNACVVVDLPFGSYQGSKEQAFQTASHILAETGCAAVKLEGGAEMAETIEFLNARGVPVMAHIGLMPQQVNTMGGFKSQGRGDDAAQKMITDAKAVAKAGVWSGLCGLRVLDGCIKASSVDTVLPMIIAPAALSRATRTASSSGTRPSSNGVPLDVGIRAVSMTSFNPTGTPCNGPIAAPD